MDFDQVVILLWIILPILFIITTYFIIVQLSLRSIKKQLREIDVKLGKKLKEAESKLANQLKKESADKEKNREQQILRIKRGIDEILHDVHR